MKKILELILGGLFGGLTFTALGMVWEGRPDFSVYCLVVALWVLFILVWTKD
jgi:hypothetical protein